MAYDIPWTPAPNNKLLTIADVWRQPTVSDVLQLARFANEQQERRPRDAVAGAPAAEERPQDERGARRDENAPEAAGTQAAPQTSAREASLPWREQPTLVGAFPFVPTLADIFNRFTPQSPSFDTTSTPRFLARPRGSARLPYMQTLPYDQAVDAAKPPAMPYNPATDASRVVPVGLRRPDLFALSSPPRTDVRQAPPGGRNREMPGSRGGDGFLVALKMMESDDPAAMRMGLSLLRSLNRAGGSRVDLPESLPGSRAYTDLARGIQSIVADGSLDAGGRVEALNALAARVQGRGEEAAAPSGAVIDMSAIDAELARRGVV